MDIYEHFYTAFLGELSEEEVQDLVKEQEVYPYFSLLTILLAKSRGTEKDLQNAAIYAPNRTTLRDFMQGKLYFAEIQRQKEMQENQDRRTYVALFPPHPYDSFSILPDLGKPTGMNLEDANQPLSLLEEGKRNEKLAFLSLVIATQSCKYLYLVEEVKTSLKAFRHSEEKKRKRTVEADDLVHQFLEKLPRISAFKDQPVNVTHAERAAAASIEHDEEIVSETLAHLHIRQKNYDEAIRIFKLLSLRFPEKKAYFTSQIEKIQKN